MCDSVHLLLSLFFGNSLILDMHKLSHCCHCLFVHDRRLKRAKCAPLRGGWAESLCVGFDSRDTLSQSHAALVSVGGCGAPSPVWCVCMCLRACVRALACVCVCFLPVVFNILVFPFHLVSKILAVANVSVSFKMVANAVTRGSEATDHVSSLATHSVQRMSQLVQSVSQGMSSMNGLARHVSVSSLAAPAFLYDDKALAIVDSGRAAAEGKAAGNSSRSRYELSLKIDLNSFFFNSLKCKVGYGRIHLGEGHGSSG